MFQIEVTYRALLAGFRVVEVPIVFRDRKVGTSKMSSRIALEAMWAVPHLRRTAPAAVRGRAVAPARSDRLAMGSRTQASAIHEGVSRRVRRMTTERHDQRNIARASSLT